MKQRLKDICSGITDGSHNPPKGGPVSDYLMISSKNIFDDQITLDEPRFLTEEQFALENKRTNIHPGDVLMTVVGTVGRVAVVNENLRNITLQRSVAVLHPNKEICNSRFLMYALKAKRSFFDKEAHGVAQKGLYLKQLSDVEIFVPEMCQQAEYVDTLDRVSNIICERQSQLEQLDNLIKARFVELFGDPVEHLDNGETVKLDTIADRITVGFVGEASNDYVGDGVPYLRTQNVRVNHIDLSGLIYVSESFHQRNEKSIIHPGDVVISRVGVNRGMAAVIPDSLEEANIANCLIVGKTTKVNPFYLAFYMNMSFGKRPQFGASVGSAQGVVNTSILKKWEVYLPTRDLQEEFYQFAKQVDKSKVAVQKALDETQTLFDSLMQKYFG